MNSRRRYKRRPSIKCAFFGAVKFQELGFLALFWSSSLCLLPDPCELAKIWPVFACFLALVWVCFDCVFLLVFGEFLCWFFGCLKMLLRIFGFLLFWSIFGSKPFPALHFNISAIGFLYFRWS